MTELNFENLTAEEREFRAALENAKIPTTAEGLKADFQETVDASDLTITNTSAFSPFWNLIQSILIVPVEWLLAFMVRHVMPNMYVKTASGWFLDVLANAYDVERKQATKAIGQITFYRDSVGQPLIIPAGSAIRTIAINGTIYRVIVTEETAFEIFSNSCRVPVEAEATGPAYNLAADYYTILETEIPGVTAVTNETDWLNSPGTDTETDTLFRLRIRNQFSAVSDWHTDAKYVAMISEYTGFSPDRIFWDHEAPDGPGSADAYILFDSGVIPQDSIDAVQDYILTQGNHGHGDKVRVKPIPESYHDVSVTVMFEPYVGAETKITLLSEVEQFIRCAFRENSDYSEYVTQTLAFDRFSWSRLDQELHNYFNGIKSFSWGQADIVSNLDVPRLNTLTITEG